MDLKEAIVENAMLVTKGGGVKYGLSHNKLLNTVGYKNKLDNFDDYSPDAKDIREKAWSDGVITVHFVRDLCALEFDSSKVSRKALSKLYRELDNQGTQSMTVYDHAKKVKGGMTVKEFINHMR